LSAYGELTYALSDKPEKRPFDPATASVQKYDDQDYQTVYFVAESFEDMKEKVRQFAAAIKRPAEVRYDPYTQTIQILDNMDSIRDVTLTLKGELNSLCNAFVKIGQHVRK
jgi:phenylalanine-4-hydroxylase